MHRWVVTAAFVLILFAVEFGATVFLGDGAWAERLKDRGEVVAAVLTVVALIVGALALVLTTIVESADYKALQGLKQDVARLLVTLNTILLNQAMHQGSGAPAHAFDAEKRAVHDFLNSTSAFGLYALVAERGRAAGASASEWRVLFMYLWEIVVSDDRRLVALRAAQAQALLKTLKPADLKLMMRHLSSLVRGITEFDLAQRQDTLMTAMVGVLLKPPPAPGPATAGRGAAPAGVGAAPPTAASPASASAEDKLRALKGAGVVDPDLDLFIAVFDNDEALLKAAIAAGADVKITDGAVLARHAAVLRKLGLQ